MEIEIPISCLEALRSRAGPPDTSRHPKSCLEALRSRAGPPDLHGYLIAEIRDAFTFTFAETPSSPTSPSSAHATRSHADAATAACCGRVNRLTLCRLFGGIRGCLSAFRPKPVDAEIFCSVARPVQHTTQAKAAFRNWNSRRARIIDE